MDSLNELKQKLKGLLNDDLKTVTVANVQRLFGLGYYNAVRFCEIMAYEKTLKKDNVSRHYHLLNLDSFIEFGATVIAKIVVLQKIFFREDDYCEIERVCLEDDNFKKLVSNAFELKLDGEKNPAVIFDEISKVRIDYLNGYKYMLFVLNYFHKKMKSYEEAILYGIENKESDDLEADSFFDSVLNFDEVETDIVAEILNKEDKK